MKSAFRFAALAVALSALTGTVATAQWGTNGANATMTVQGLSADANDPVSHNIQVVTPGQLVLTVDSGVNPGMGIILLYSAVNPELIANGGSVPITPLPFHLFGSLDLGIAPTGTNVVIAADGVSLSVNPTVDAFYRTTLSAPFAFTQSLTASQVLCGGRIAVQCILQDATNGPFFYDSTEAADCNFVNGSQFNLLTGDDGMIQVPLAAGHSFDFHGVNYTEMYVGANGLITFGGFTTVAGNGFTVDAVGFRAAEPAVAVWMCDWGIANGGPLDGVLFDEVGNVLRVEWGAVETTTFGGIAHFGDGDYGNQFGARFQLSVDPNIDPCSGVNPNAGNFSIYCNAVDFNTFQRPGDGLFGHTPGGAVVVNTATNDLFGSIQIGNANENQLEEHNQTTFNQSVIGWDNAGTNRFYNEARSFFGNEITFNATGSPAGAGGYLSIPANTPPDDVTGVDLPSIDTAGGQTLTIYGKFFGFGAGSVVFDPSGVNLAGAFLGTVPAGSGLFTNEAIQVITPPGLSLGTITVDVNFAGSGYTESFVIAVTNPGSFVTSYTLPDDGNVFHTLTSNTITFYGTSYNSFYVNSNGYVTFTAGGFDFTSSMADFFNGFTLASPGVAVHYCDLNSGGTTSGATYTVVEDTVLLATSVNYNNQNFWNTILPAGTFSVTFENGGPDTGFFDFTGYIPDAGSGDNRVIGVTDGITGGVDTDLSGLGFTAAIPYIGSSGPESAGASENTGLPISFGAGASLQMSWINLGPGGLFFF